MLSSQGPPVHCPAQAVPKPDIALYRVPVKYLVMPHIETTEPPVHARRLAPVRYRQAKAELESLLRQGIAQSSSVN